MKKRNILLILLFLLGLIPLNLSAQENKSYDEQKIEYSRAAGLFDLPDDNLEKIIMDSVPYVGALGTMSEDELLKVDKIKVDDTVSELDGLDYYIQKGLLDNVYRFDSTSTKVVDFSPIMNWSSLQEIWISNSPITNLNCFANTTFDDLGKISIEKTTLNDISGLSSSNMPNLYEVRLPENKLTNLNGLNNKKTIETVTVYMNEINDISGLANLPELKTLTINQNKLTNLDALENDSNLRYIYADENEIEDISGIKNSPYLLDVTFFQNKISDISALEGHDYLTSVDISYNKVSDLSPLSKMSGDIYAPGQMIDMDLGDFDNLSKIPLEAFVIQADGTKVSIDYGLDINDIKDYKEYSYSPISFDASVPGYYDFNGEITVKFDYVAPTPLTPLDPSIPITIPPSKPVDPIDPSTPDNIDTVGNKNGKETKGKKLIQTGKENFFIIVLITVAISSNLVLKRKVNK